MPSKDYSRDASAWDICRSFVGRLPGRAIFGAGLVYVCHAGHHGAAADIGNAYRVFVVSTAVGSWLLDWSPYFHIAVKSDDVVITYILPAIRLVPLPYLLDGIIMPRFGGGAMDYNIVNLPHYRPPCRLQPAVLGCCTNRQ